MTAVKHEKSPTAVSNLAFIDSLEECYDFINEQYVLSKTY